jgi:hypothetical protein
MVVVADDAFASVSVLNDPVPADGLFKTKPTCKPVVDAHVIMLPTEEAPVSRG